MRVSKKPNDTVTFGLTARPESRYDTSMKMSAGQSGMSALIDLVAEKPIGA